jgi:hypothetical protein
VSDETPPSEATPPAEATPRPDDSEVGSYLDVQAEVDKHFAGDWEKFLKAVRNPAEILYFVLWRQCDGKAHKLEAWAKDKGLPADWLPRFYGMLKPDGQFREGVVTSAPDASQLGPEPIVTMGEPKAEAEAKDEEQGS